MNQELADSLAEVVDLAKSGVVEATNIVQTQAPEIAEQIITWGIISNLTRAIVCFSIFVLCIIIFIKAYEYENESDCYDSGGIIFMICSAVIGASSIILGIVSLYHLLMVYFVPKLYLIRVIGILINGSCG